MTQLQWLMYQTSMFVWMRANFREKQKAVLPLDSYCALMNNVVVAAATLQRMGCTLAAGHPCWAMSQNVGSI
jgi:hypothetical protein